MVGVSLETTTMITKMFTLKPNELTLSWVEHSINTIRNSLPIQHPMPFFVHNNPLQNWEIFPFHEGIEKAVLAFENTGEKKSRVFWRELEDFVLPIVISYFDQGLNRWNLESHKSAGLWQWYLHCVNSSLNFKASFLPELKSALQNTSETTLFKDIATVLEFRCPRAEHWFSHLQALILHFKGWSGMIQILEKNPDLYPLVKRKISLVDWVAILVITESAINAQNEKPWWGKPLWNPDPIELRKKTIQSHLHKIKNHECTFYQSFLHQLRSHLNLQLGKSEFLSSFTLQSSSLSVTPSPLEIPTTSDPTWIKSSFPPLNLLEPQETELTSSGSSKSSPFTSETVQIKTANEVKSNPHVQVLLCLDDREESIRRAIESINPHYETFGVLGFFGIDVKLKRPGHLISQPHCPPVIQARKIAEEIPPTPHASSWIYTKLKSFLPYFNESHFTFIEPLITILFWPIYAVFLTMRSLTPQLYSQIRQNFQTDVYLNSASSIHFITPYTIQEKVSLVAELLGGAGLHEITAPLVIAMGHASTTSNNPFQKSYGCGACSGQSGFSNAKVFSEFANDPTIRAELKHLGIIIHDHVTFLAACHDTSQDHAVYADQNETYLQTHQEKQTLYQQFKNDMKLALQKNKEERWNQFQLPTYQTAQARSADWSQPRPEFGHTGVSLAIFGPRSLTQGLDLKRKAFLMSYEPHLDPTGQHLSYVILNALPVCANINLDYYTSAAFPKAFGAGSKLPLNIVSGLGMMSGSKGDLRVGLSTQMIDRHEPLRLLSLVYCEKAHLEKAISSSPRLQNIIKNNWIHLIRIDPSTLQFEMITDELKRDFKNDSTFSH